MRKLKAHTMKYYWNKETFASLEGKIDELRNEIYKRKDYDIHIRAKC